ncbi:MAG: hypothetical protein M3Z75_25495 [Actinomycetota bacterium]|nr:hypothetical protein [Actinomycetota bacterium]
MAAFKSQCTTGALLAKVAAMQPATGWLPDLALGLFAEYCALASALAACATVGLALSGCSRASGRRAIQAEGRGGPLLQQRVEPHRLAGPRRPGRRMCL